MQTDEKTNKVKQIHPAFKLRHRLKGHTQYVLRMDLSPNGKILALPYDDGNVGIWDIERGKLYKTFDLHKNVIIAWSPNGRVLASGDLNDPIIRIWDVEKGKLLRVLEGHDGEIYCLAWLPDGLTLVSGSFDNSIRLWDIVAGKSVQILNEHLNIVSSIACSPNGKNLCSGSFDHTIRLWEVGTGKELRILKGHTWGIFSVAYSPDGKKIASGSGDKTVRIWDVETGQLTNILEAHTDYVVSVSFFANGRLLSSLSKDGRVVIWRTDTWTEVLSTNKIGDAGFLANFSYHPVLPVMVTSGDSLNEINVWDIDLNLLLNITSADSAIHYINVKVVLVGDSGVGKSGLGIRMAEKEFRVTQSTHGAQFWQIPVIHDVVRDEKPPKILAELTLWDLAGQPEYRLVHQLFLDDTDVALLLFDCSDSNDPFRGVPYWAKVLKRHSPSHAIKILVSARSDVSPVTADQQQINETLAKYGMDQHFVTSAFLNEGVESLFQYILHNIPWDRLPRTTTPRLFQVIRELLLEEKAVGKALIPLEDIKNKSKEQYSERQTIDGEIDTVIYLLQSRGFIYRLESQSNITMILLKPEQINQYAASIIQAARNHPLAIGAVSERDVLIGNLSFSGFERLPREQERIVLEATVELLIGHDLCFREMGYLVFPSQINVTRPVPPEEHPRTEVAYRFSGSIETIYASLVVRLSHTDHFQREDQWKYAVEFSRDEIRLGFAMRQVEEGTGELEIYFYPGISEFDRVTFIRFITEHLRAKGIDIKEQIKLYCHRCDKEIKNLEAIEQRVRGGYMDIPCQYCGIMVIIPRSIEDRYQRDPSLVQKQRELARTVERRTEQEIKEFKIDQRQYTGEDDKMIHILHLSDIHLCNESQAKHYRVQLEADLIQELKIKRLEYLVISGDIANFSIESEYKGAFELVDGLVKRFGLDSTRVIIVPGNHDLNWDLSEEAYPFVPKRKLPDKLDTETHIPAGETGALIRDDTLYQKRFANYNVHFYKKVNNGQEYPTEYSQQTLFIERPEDRILFLGFNSAWQVDHHFTKRSGINQDALANALDQIQNGNYDDWLKIAVWHHPVTGKEMMNDEFMEQLTVHGFKICMHGHIHEAMEGFHKYDDKRGIRIIGAGTFGAPAKEQTTGIPLQYNLLTYDKDERTITVKTRKKEKVDGAWAADARWGDKNDPKAIYSFKV
ncbi:MAG TPA: metallophosphoesterase [Bacillota bacterium]|nr:metallophosphoesterase [Bacillota bacterium]